MEKNLYVSRMNQTLGPLSLDDLKSQLDSKKIEFTDFIWSEEEHAWQLLAIYFQSDFTPPKNPPDALAKSDKTPAKKSAKIPTHSPDLKKFAANSFDQQFGISNEAIWFLFRNQEKYGPYRFLELVQLLQENKCEPMDFIWKPGFQDWQRVRSVAEFSQDILEKLANVKNFSGINLDTVFIKRQFPRVPYDSEVILHDDKQVVIGNATTISEGGAFVSVAKPIHNRGDRLKLHFSSGGVNVPFNCIAEVTQVCKTEPSGYCLKFIYLEQEDQTRIAKFANQPNRKEA